MSPESLPQPGSAQDWLRYAASDLQLAQASDLANVMLESLCWHAQQCAEKAIKAVLVVHGISIHKTHNIGLLLNLLDERVAIPANVEEAAILTDYAVASRYPGDVEPVTSFDYQEAVRLAEVVLGWARQIVK